MNDDGGSVRSARRPCWPWAGCEGVVTGVMRTSGLGVGGAGLMMVRSKEEDALVVV